MTPLNASQFLPHGKRGLFESLAIAIAGISLATAARADWWKVPHHMAQTIADTTQVVGPIAAVIAAGVALTLRSSALTDLGALGSRRPLVVSMRLLGWSIRSATVGWLLAVCLLSIFVAISAGRAEFIWLHLVVATLFVSACAVLGAAVATRIGHPAVVPAVGLLILVLPTALAFQGFGTGIDQVFPADFIPPGTMAKANDYLLLQGGVSLGLLIAAIALHGGIKLVAGAGLAFALGCGGVVVGLDPLRSEPAYTEASCSTLTQDTTLCVTAIHRHLIDDYRRALIPYVEVVNRLAPVDVLLDHGVNTSDPSVRTAAGDGRVVEEVSSFSDFDSDSNILDEQETVDQLKPVLVGVRHCRPAVFPEMSSGNSDTDDFVDDGPPTFTLTPQGEVYLWFLRQFNLQSDSFLDFNYEETGLARRLDAMTDAERIAWYAANEEALVSCEVHL